VRNAEKRQVAPHAELPPAGGRRRPIWRPIWRVTWRLSGLALIGLSLYYAYRVVGTDLRDLDLSAVRVLWGPLVLSVLLTVVCVGLGGRVWQLVLQSAGHSLSLGACLRVQTTSNMAKYLPGYAWQLLGKGYLTSRAGVPAGEATIVLLIELALSLLTAALVAWGFLPVGNAPPALSFVTPGLWWGGLALLTAAVLALPWVAGRALIWLSARMRRPSALEIRGRYLWRAALCLVGSWLLFGLSYALTTRALYVVDIEYLPIAIFVLSMSFVVSLLTPFVPAGLGVREGVMIYALVSLLPGDVAALVAVASRVSLVLSEVGAFGLVQLLTTTRWRRNRSITHSG